MNGHEEAPGGVKPPQARNHHSHRCSPVKVTRVGGGYHVELDPTAVSPAYLASCETFKALPAPEGPYTDYDLSIIYEILQLADATAQQEYAAGRGSNLVTLVKVLQAYEIVLQKHGVVPSEDVHYYRALLQLSLDQNTDWFAKLQQLQSEQQRHPGRSRMPKNSKLGKLETAAAWAAAAAKQAGTQGSGLQPTPVLVPAASVGAPAHGQQRDININQQVLIAADAKAKVALPAATKLQQADAAAGIPDFCSLAAIEAAAASVNAATAAVAAALAEARVSASGSGQTATAAQSQRAAELSPTQQKQLAVAADKWMEFSHTLHCQPMGAAVSCGSGLEATPNRKNSWSDLIAAVDAVEGIRTLHNQGLISGYNSSPADRCVARHRSRSVSPLPVGIQTSRVGPAAEAAVLSRAGVVNARRRSRSVSPVQRTPQQKSSSPTYRLTHPVMYEWHSSWSPPSSAAGHFQAPDTTAANNFRCSLGAGVAPGSAAICDELGNTQQMRCSSPWKAEAAASYLSDLALDQYVRFSRRMHNQHNWQQKVLEMQTARDLQVAAEHRWRLAMSFWEVHCVWHCFRRWRSWAAIAAEESSASYRHWLLLCSFRWWKAMVQHYRRERQQQEQQHMTAAAGNAAAAITHSSSSLLHQVLQHVPGRPCSPLTGVSRLLQQQPHLRPPTSAACALRQHPSGKVLVGCVFTAWAQLVKQRREGVHVQSLLAWHHIQHVQAGVWNKWRVAFERKNPCHKLMRIVYQGRRHSTMRRVVHHWRAWAPSKRAKRRRLRNMQMQLTHNKRGRLWRAFREYMTRRRARKCRKATAIQHYRLKSLHKHLQQWAHILDITDAFQQLSDKSAEGVMQRRAGRMLRWWKDWRQQQQQKYEQEEMSWSHMATYKALRCLAGWQGLVARRQQLEELEQLGHQISAIAAGRTAFKAWHQVADVRKRHKDTMLAIATSVLRRQLATAWRGWAAYVLCRQQQQQDLLQLSQFNTQRVWQQTFTAWRSALQERVQLAQAVDSITSNMVRRCVQHWKAWVDRKVDWRSFEAVAVQQLLRTRLNLLLRQWHSTAMRKAVQQGVLAEALQARARKHLQEALAAWHNHLTRRVAKRMNQLSALLHWEQSLLKKALIVWLQHAEVWRRKRLRLLRADSYHALRLMNLALTSWTSLWTEGQELKQKAAFYVIGRQAELSVHMLRAWRDEAAWIRLKRERMDIAAQHSAVARQQQVLTAWRAETQRRTRMRTLLVSCVQRWSHMTLARALEQWRSWALEKAALHRKAKAVMALLAGRTVHWAFCMMREHTLRKRRTRSARHYHQKHLARSVVKAWRQQTADGVTFREVLVSLGLKLKLGCLAETFTGWRDVVRAKQWKQAVMMRALVLWGANKKKLCFHTWRQWTAMKQGRHHSLLRALKHWRHLYLQQSFAWWRAYTDHKKVAFTVMEHFRLRHLHVALSTWRAWYQRKAYLAAVFNKLQGRGHQQILQVVWNAWRAFVPSNQVRRQVNRKANTYRYRRLQAVCFFSWQDYATYQANKREQLTVALLHWSSRKLATTLRAWKQSTELQLYRRHVVEVVSGKLTNASLLRALNAWRDLVDAKIARRMQSAAAHSHWTRHELIKAFTLWSEETKEGRMLGHWRQRLLSQAFRRWHTAALLAQQHGMLINMMSVKRLGRLLHKAWTAWREVIDQRRQVSSRLRGVANHLVQSDLTRVVDAWREVVLLQELARMALAKHNAGMSARCLLWWRQWVLHRQLKHNAAARRRAQVLSSCTHCWRAVASNRRAASNKVQAFRAQSIHQLAVSILQEWAELAWEMPRERRAFGFQDRWLKQRSMWAWYEWVRLKARWQQLESDVATHWCNLHLAAAWRTWGDWVKQRQQKQQQVDAVAAHWRNLQLAAAFQAWFDWVQVSRHHSFVHQTIAGRWRNLHIAAAFGAWRSFVTAQKASRAASETVAQRWNNLHLAAAFGAWKDATQAAAARATAAETEAQQKIIDKLAVMFFKWKDYAAQQAQLQSKASHMVHRRNRAELGSIIQGWRAVVQWRNMKQSADLHWRLVVLQSLLRLWRTYSATKERHKLAVLTLLSRSELYTQRRCLLAWRQYALYRCHKAAADEYVAAKMQQRVLLAWSALACHSRLRLSAAVSMAARVSARMHNKLTYDCFGAWKARTGHSRAVRGVLLRCTARRLRSYLCAWRSYSRRLAGASLLLRRQLVGTLHGAFHEWQAVALDKVHWHRVEEQLVHYIASCRSSIPSVARTAAARWLHWPVSAAFSTWKATAADQVQERQHGHRAVKFLYYALALKSLTGFRWAVQEAQVHAAAADHRVGATKRAVLRSWIVAARRVKDKRHKLMAALYSYSTSLSRKAFNVWIVYTQYRQHKSGQLVRAQRYDILARKAAVFRAWLQVTRYLTPLRQNLLQLQRKRHRVRLRQMLAAWRLCVHKSQVLRQALERHRLRVLAAVFAGWRRAAVNKIHLRSLLHSATARLNQLRSQRTLRQWRDIAQQLKALCAKAQLVLRRMLERRMHAAFDAWKAAAAHQVAKRAMLAKALQYFRRLYQVKTLVSWAAFVEEARHFQLLSSHMLQRLQQQQCQAVLGWWGLIAQDLHHHRVVLDYFRARRVRQDGGVVFWQWRTWAHERMLERKAVVAYWNRLMVTAFAAWLKHHEDLQWERAAAHDAAKRTACTMLAWKVSMALIHRKRVLTGAAIELNLQWCVRKAMNSWLRYTYYRHAGHAALHFRIRRLCCVVMREWLQAAQTRAGERLLCLELTQGYATRTVLSVLTGWQHLLVARRHHNMRLLQGCLGFWVYWAPMHSAKNARWRQAAVQLHAKKLERCFYTWRWYCQVRVLRSVAFQHKQRALQEALAIGEQVARRKRRELVAATFMAWHVQVRKYRMVAEKLAGLLQHNLTTCFKAWRAAADQARVDWLRAERYAATNLLVKLLPAWADAAAGLRTDREAAEAKSARHFRRTACKRAMSGWSEEMQVIREQRGALWRVMVMLLQHARRGLLQDVLQGWQQTAQQQMALRSCIATFVNKRRLECLSEYLTVWHQYAAAMRTDGLIIPASAAKHVNSSNASVLQAARLPARPMSAAGDFHSLRGSALNSPGGLVGSQLGCGDMSSVGLPVTGGPGSPVLGFRSAHQDRQLARRMAAISGGAPEVDPGSDDEQQLFAGLPATVAAAAAVEQHERQQPWLALSKGFRQRRMTLNDNKSHYDDAASAAAAAFSGGGHGSPRFDLHSVADSMRMAYEQGLSPWQLPSVRTSPEPKITQNTLTLDELQQYQHQYPYSLVQQPQQHVDMQQQPQVSGVIGWPGSAGGYRQDYQPLLVRQLQMHEQRLDMQRWHLEQQQQEMQQWQQQRHDVSQQGSALGSPARQQLRQQYKQQPQPWHQSPSKGKKWYQDSQGVADTHWQQRRGNILGSSSATSSGDGSTSSASAQMGSDAEVDQEQQLHVIEQQQMHHNLYGRWAIKAWERPASGEINNIDAAATAGRTTSTLPAFGQETLPKSLAALITPVRSYRNGSVADAVSSELVRPRQR